MFLAGCKCPPMYLFFSPSSPENELYEHSSVETAVHKVHKGIERAPARPKQTSFCTILNVAMRRLGTEWFKKHHKFFVDKERLGEGVGGWGDAEGPSSICARQASFNIWNHVLLLTVEVI